MKHRPTDEQRAVVLTLAPALGRGITQEDIANAIGVGVPTLLKYYQAELQKGRTAILQKAFEAAEILMADGNASVVNKILSTIGGLTDEVDHKHSGNIGINLRIGEKRVSSEDD